jgi:hypothetical protein
MLYVGHLSHYCIGGEEPTWPRSTLIPNSGSNEPSGISVTNPGLADDSEAPEGDPRWQYGRGAAGGFWTIESLLLLIITSAYDIYLTLSGTGANTDRQS